MPSIMISPEEKPSISQLEQVLTTTSNKQCAPPREDWSSQEEHEVKRKADLRVFPMLCLIFALALIDRTNIPAAYIAGLAEDLKLNVGIRYSLVTLFFFIPYTLLELPSNMVIRRIGARYWLSLLIGTWGMTALGMGLVNEWQDLLVLRTFLGVFEAGLFPGSIYIIGSWYRQYEMAKRITVFCMAPVIGQAFGPIIAYALSRIHVGDGKFLSGWRWIFIVEGAFTVAVGMIAPLFLIEFPEKVTFLTKRQKHIATTRVGLEKEGAHMQHVTFAESLKMMWDWKLVVYSVQYFINSTSVYSISFTMPIILRDGLGFPYVLAQILCSPPYVFACIVSLLLAYISDKYKVRWPIMVSQSLIGIIGLLIVLYAQAAGVRYFGLFIATFGFHANIATTLVYSQNQTAKVQKKGIVSAMATTAGGFAGIAGSFMFQIHDAPRYTPGMWATIGMQILYSVGTFCMSMYLRRLNRLADKGEKTALEGVEGFRYAP